MTAAKSFPAFAPFVLVTLAWLPARPAGALDNVWRSLGPAGVSEITSVVLDPADPRILYATSTVDAPGAVGLRKSRDGGATWVEIAAGDPDLSRLTRIAVDPSDSSALYVGSPLGLVAASHDGGATWTKTTLGATPVSAIAFEVSSGSVFASTRPSGDYDFSVSYGPAVMRSHDAGATWQETSLARPRGVYALLADSVAGSLLAGTDFAYSNGYYGGVNPSGGSVAKSPDAGATWALPSTDLGYSVTALGREPQGGRLFAATSSGQILRSGDAGATWTPLGTLPGAVSAIVVDSLSAATIYAGLSRGGVWRSVDGGQNWRVFDTGLTSSSVRSLAIDPSGRNLYAATGAGVFHRELPPANTSSCHSGNDHLCLLGSRFRVDLFAVDPSTQAPAPVRALPQGDRFGYFSFPSLTGDAALPEVFVKMLDATSLPGQGYWLFSTALSNVAYSLVVTDTTNGRVQIYDGRAFCGTADIQAFPTDPPHGSVTSAQRAKSSTVAPASELALLSGRFRLTLSATDPFSGNTVAGVAIPQADRFGYFSLPSLTGDATFPEVFVKMLDATSLPEGDFWLFQSGLTSLPYTLTVVDTTTGASRTYRHDPIDPTQLCGSADTRVTTGPAPTELRGDWVSVWSPTDQVPATVSQSGDRLNVVTSTPSEFVLFWFDGVIGGLGSVTGTLRTGYRGCRFEGGATGLAASSGIQVTGGESSGTCGTFYQYFLDLSPTTEGGGDRRGDR